MSRSNASWSISSTTASAAATSSRSSVDEADARIVDLLGEHVRVDRAHVGAEREQAVGDRDRGRLARVAGVLLVREAEQQDAGCR